MFYLPNPGFDALTWVLLNIAVAGFALAFVTAGLMNICAWHNAIDNNDYLKDFRAKAASRVRKGFYTIGLAFALAITGPYGLALLLVVCLTIGLISLFKIARKVF